jgi:hypothetical protein
MSWAHRPGPRSLCEAINWPGDGLFEEEIEELNEFVAEVRGKRKPDVLKVLNERTERGCVADQPQQLCWSSRGEEIYPRDSSRVAAAGRLTTPPRSDTATVTNRSPVACPLASFTVMKFHFRPRAMRLLACAAFLCLLPAASAQGLKTKNAVLITSDGLRWQELFTGADPELINKEWGGVVNTNALKKSFWRDTPEARREALLPFFWGTIAKQGQIYGNQHKGSVARITNDKKFL